MARTEALRIECRSGEALRSAFGPLADLRIRVFREFPYLYEGSTEYEQKYLEVYARSPRSLVVLAWDGSVVVGASTVIPLADAPSEMQAPFVRASMDLGRVDYFGESVVLADYRGRGLGSRFFELREEHARSERLAVCAFCAVHRAENHPLRPADYTPNDAFWQKRGYQKVPTLQAELSWLDRDQNSPTKKQMLFWLKQLEG